MKTKAVFKRYELKYLVTSEQKSEILKLLSAYMRPDEFGQSSIFNLYYDTEDYLLIRRSLEKNMYKEKLRLRSYGKAEENTKVFLEIKRKFDDVVYKRRISLREQNAIDYFNDRFKLPDSQIGKEIDYFKSLYPTLASRMLISYDREAFFGKEDGDFRITFDENILWRSDDLSLCNEKYGEEIIQKGMVLMEIKVASGIPLWLTHFLTENKIYKTSFSKYGNAYKVMMKRKEVLKYAA